MIPFINPPGKNVVASSKISWAWENVVATSKKSWAWKPCVSPITPVKMVWKSLKYSNVGFSVADLAYLDIKSSLVCKVSQKKIAGLCTNMVESPLNNLYTRALLLELEKYDAIPFYLAFIYLSCKPNSKLYFGDYSAQYSALHSSVGVHKSGIGFKRNGETAIYSFKNGLDKAHRITPQTLFSFSPLRPTKTYYYSQNTNLVGLINYQVNESMRVKGQVNMALVYPYLFLNKDAELNQAPTKAGMVLKGGFPHPSQIKYDPQSKLLKMRISEGSKKFRILKPDQMMDLYDGGYDWRAMTFTLPIT